MRVRRTLRSSGLGIAADRAGPGSTSPRGSSPCRTHEPPNMCRTSAGNFRVHEGPRQLSRTHKTIRQRTALFALSGEVTRCCNRVHRKWI
jgi:hypothetical protein